MRCYSRSLYSVGTVAVTLGYSLGASTHVVGAKVSSFNADFQLPVVICGSFNCLLVMQSTR